MISCSVQDAVNLLTLLKYLLSSIVSLLSRTSIDGSIFLLVLLVLFINISKNLLLSFLKAGAKIKALFLTTKLFRKFFLFFLFTHFSGSLCERERMYKRKNKGRFLCESDCKDKNFIYYTPKLFGSFLFFSLSAISLFHYVNSARLSSLGKRVQKYALFVYNPNILNSFFEVFLKESAKALKDNDVVEHIFLS